MRQPCPWKVGSAPPPPAPRPRPAAWRRPLGAVALGWLCAVGILPVAAAAPAAPTAPAAPAAPDAATPQAAALRFERAFEAADFAALRQIFLPEAMVVRTALSSEGDAEQFHFTAKQWTDDAEQSHVMLRDVHLEVLDTAVVRQPWGAVVNVRSRFSGRAGRHSFVSNGIDSFTMVERDGAWRVLQYAYLERLESH
jgi:hypothetical protein